MIVLGVEDDGKGITEHDISDTRSLGIIGIRERVLLLGGRLRISGSTRKGTVIVATIPLKRPDENHGLRSS